MKMTRRKIIRLTFSTVTEESAGYGDHATHGFVTRNQTIPDRAYLPKNPATFSLKEAIEFCQNHGSTLPVEADSCPISLKCPPRWFSFTNEKQDGDVLSVTVSLHLPRNVTPSSAMRVARLLGCYGIR